MRRGTLKKILSMWMVLLLFLFGAIPVSANPYAGIPVEEIPDIDDGEGAVEKLEADYKEFLAEKELRESKIRNSMDAKAVTEKVPYDEVIFPVKEELSSPEIEQVDYAVQLSGNPKRAAEVLNTYDDAVFEVALAELLDEYFKDVQNVQREEIDVFSEYLNERADSILDGYEEALEERQNAETLDYETEHVLVAFDEGITYDKAKEITDRVGDDVYVLDGTGRSLEECIAENECCTDGQIMVKVNIGISKSTQQVIDLLEKIDGVAIAERNGCAKAEGLEAVNDPGKDQQTYLQHINLPEAWDTLTSSYNYDYKMAKVAVIDSGLNVGDPELKNVISKDSASFSVPGKEGEAVNLFEHSIPDVLGHGTGVAGIIAAESNNNLGVVGMTSIYNDRKGSVENWCEILALIAAESGTFYVDYEVAAINYAIEHDVDVINMSYGIYNFSSEMVEAALGRAHKADIVLVASAGNRTTSDPHYPSGYENVISVGALDASGEERASWSSFGDTLDLMAVGTDVYRLDPTMGMGLKMDKGTSFAAPQVAATAALIRAINPDLPVNTVEFVLTNTTDDLGEPGWDQQTGYGRLNVDRAVQYAKIAKYYSTQSQPADVQVALKDFQTVQLSIGIPYLAEYFEIRRGEDVNGKIVYKTIADHVGFENVQDGRVIFEDRDFELDKTYYYQVIDKVSGYFFGSSGEFSRNDNPSPVQIKTYYKVDGILPSVTLVLFNQSKPTIRFDYNYPYDYFMLMRSTSRDEGYSVIAAIDAKHSNFYTDNTAEAGVTYYYKAYVAYTDENGNMLYSPESNIVKYTQN